MPDSSDTKLISIGEVNVLGEQYSDGEKCRRDACDTYNVQEGELCPNCEALYMSAVEIISLVNESTNLLMTQHQFRDVYE